MKTVAMIGVQYNLLDSDPSTTPISHQTMDQDPQLQEDLGSPEEDDIYESYYNNRFD